VHRPALFEHDKVGMAKGIALLCCFLLLFSCSRPKQQDRFSRTAIRTKKSLPLVILDPGHGGMNDGTKMCLAPYTKEKTLTLQTAMKVRDLLEQWGYHVKMTRTRDVFIPLAERVSFAQDAKGHLFVSIHFNHAPNKNANGIEIFYYDKNKYAARSKQLAESILDTACKRLKAASRGCLPGNYHVLRENSTMPAILIEGGFFSNPHEASKLSDPQYVRSLALSIAQGIDTFVHKL
jgi:N-acetylmuramoyl-L-alanine amidase